MNLPQLVQKVYQGAGLPGTTIVPPAYKRYHWEPPADQKMTYDPAKAGQLLDAAGYKKGADGLRTMPNGKPIGTLRLDARSDSTDVAEHHGLLQVVAGPARDQGAR